jgi:hypothetical protein
MAVRFAAELRHRLQGKLDPALFDVRGMTAGAGDPKAETALGRTC